MYVYVHVKNCSVNSQKTHASLSGQYQIDGILPHWMKSYTVEDHTQMFTAGKFQKFKRQSEWPEWKQRIMHYRTATKLSLEVGNVHVSALIYSMGKDAENIFK